MKIRKATLEDKKQILSLVGKFYGRSSPKTVRKWKKYYKKMIKITFVYEINKKIIAYISCTSLKDCIYICDLYVLPKYRRKGIATKLLKEIEKSQKKAKKRYLRVNNRKRDKAAFKLYTKFGFKIEKNEKSKKLIK